MLSIYFILVEGRCFFPAVYLRYQRYNPRGDFTILPTWDDELEMHDNPSTIAHVFVSRKRAPNVLNHTRTYPDAARTSIVVVRESDVSEARLHVSVSEALPKGLVRFNGSGANQLFHKRIDDPLLASGKTGTRTIIIVRPIK